MINNLEVNTNSNASQKFRFILIKIKTIIGQKKVLLYLSETTKH